MTKLFAIGDICLSCYKEENFLSSTGYKDVLRIFRNYDGLRIGNFECPFTDSEQSNSNKIALKSAPEYVNYLPDIDVLSLSNNHISDAGHEGAQETIQHLRRKNIVTVGYGSNIFEARRPVVIEKNDVRIGFLAYSCLTTNGENYAGSVKEGVCPIALPYIEQDIAGIIKDVDHIIVFFHWGDENTHYPTPDQVYIAHGVIDCGANVVIGTHPHVIQGIETYRNGIIAYSLGNFMFHDLEFEIIRDNKRITRTLKQNPLNKESIGIELTITKERVSIDRIMGFTFDEYFLPNMVPVEKLGSNLSELNTNLKRYLEKLNSYISTLDGLQIKVVFNGAIYQYRYALEGIDTISR